MSERASVIERLQGMKAPDGSCAVENLKSWLASGALLDENGEILSSFHGTDGEFSVFVPSVSGSFGSGIYSADETAAELYAGEDGRAIEIVIRMNKPYRYQARFAEEGGAGEAYDLDSAAVDLVLELLPEDEATAAIERARENDARFGREIEDALTQRGYDGLIAQYADGSREYVVFSPYQVKAIDGNCGAFDQADPDIFDAKARVFQQVAAANDVIWAGEKFMGKDLRGPR